MKTLILIVLGVLVLAPLVLGAWEGISGLIEKWKMGRHYEVRESVKAALLGATGIVVFLVLSFYMPEWAVIGVMTLVGLTAWIVYSWGKPKPKRYKQPDPFDRDAWAVWSDPDAPEWMKEKFLQRDE